MYSASACALPACSVLCVRMPFTMLDRDFDVSSDSTLLAPPCFDIATHTRKRDAPTEAKAGEGGEGEPRDYWLGTATSKPQVSM